ncbi:UNVERIFIED_CONTAM: hypothetical protein PYX00_008272 [Menopon gallinae]|uniref:Tudor domain-containing protein n=1 Tax=Menopon gallinae TaxID=328185 RepID=A0AAW2HNJ5_9NEOP
MDKTFLELEVQALKCSLPNLSPNGRDSWPEPDPEIDKIFEHEKYSCKFLNSANGVREVELTILENGKSVRDELISAGFAVPVDPVKQPEKDITDSITDKSPPIDFTLMKGEILNVYVTHIVDPSEFFVQMEFNVWEAVEKELKEYVESKDPTPLLKNSVNELCLVKVGEEWFRARIIEKTDSGANIQLIDYGKKLDVTNDQIKHIPDNLAGYPPQAVQCSIDCDSEVPSNVADEFKKCEKNYYIGFVQDISKNRLRLTLYNPDGSKLECLRSVNDAPIEVCPVGNLPLFHKETTVMVSYIASPNEVYIHRKADSSAVEELHTLLTEFYNTGGEDFQQDESNYKICAAKSTADNCWYRARVLSLSGQSVTVFYIDYGNVETVPVENVKNLDRTLYEQHAFAKKVSLNIDCDEDCVGEMTEKLCGLLENKEVVGFFAKVDDITYAELVLDGTSVSDTLNAKKINNDLFKPMVKPEEDNAIRVYISHVTSPNEFWVNEERICQELITFQEKIQNICAEGSPKKDVRVGDIVGGIFTDQLWYRMKVLGIEDKIVDVQFIDYGNSLKIDTSENVMIELPQDVVDVPVFAGYCSLKGRWKSEAAARFEEIITNHQDLFTLVELDNKNPRCVDLLQNGSSVTQQLISEGLEDEDGDKFVYISHINSPSDFYIRTGSNKELFDKVTSAMLEGDKFPDAKGEVGQIYCAKFPKDDSHRRARVVKIDADSITVNFIDHGMSCTVENVKELPEDLGKMPALARNCGLVYGNCIDTWSDAACDKFKEYLNQRLTLETVAEGYARSLVKLFTEDGKELTTILSDLCEEDGRTYVYVSHANSPNDFYIQNVVDENFGIITGRLVDGDALEDLKEKKVGAYCAAKDPQNDIWSRAEIKKIIGDQCELFFPDFGSTALSAELKELPEDVRFLPPAAKWCSLNLPIANVPECLKEEFANMTGGGDSIFRSRVIRPGDCTIVSLISDGKKLEEVLLLSENLIFDGENQQPRIDAGECEDSAFEDSDLKENYTDEEKTVIFSISREGFRSDDEKGLEKSSDALKYIGRNECQDSFEDTSMKESESDTNLNVTNSTNDSNSDDKVDQEECRTKLGKTLLEDKIVPGSIAMGVVPDTDDTRELSTVTAESEKPFAQNHSG